MNYKALCFALLLAGCSSTSSTPVAKGDYKLNLTDFAAHATEASYLKIKDATGATTLASVNTTVDAKGSATFDVPAILDEGTTYRVDFAITRPAWERAARMSPRRPATLRRSTTTRGDEWSSDSWAS